MEYPRIAKASPTAWLVWSIGILAYGIAVMQRTSLGVVGIQAADHFDTTVGIVSTFVVVQLATYAIMQIPVGTLLDRFGSRAVLTVGSAVMAAGQLILASTELLPVAIGARILVGMGDACIFTAIVRLLPFWFPTRGVPMLTQLTGLLGQIGQIGSVAMLLPLMIHFGWLRTFAAAAAVSLAIAAVCFIVVRDVPPGVDRIQSGDTLRELPRSLAQVVTHPAAALGFWIHLTSGFAANVFVMMWGIPFLRIGQGLSEAQASGLFILSAVLGAFFGPTIGWLTARHPLRRSTLALLVIFASIACWTAVLVWPGNAPMWLLVLLIVAVAAGGPGTAIGLDLARTGLPPHRLGAGTGVVITGSFSGGTFAILIIGMALDLMSGTEDYTARQMRLAMALQLPIFAVGLVGIFVSRRRLRRRMAAEGVIVPSWREVIRRYRRNANDT